MTFEHNGYTLTNTDPINICDILNIVKNNYGYEIEEIMNMPIMIRPSKNLISNGKEMIDTALSIYEPNVSVRVEPIISCIDVKCRDCIIITI